MHRSRVEGKRQQEEGPSPSSRSPGERRGAAVAPEPPAALSGREDGGARDVFVDGPTIFGHGAVAPLQDEGHRPAAVFDQFYGARVLHAFGALAVNLQNLVPYLKKIIIIIIIMIRITVIIIVHIVVAILN